MGYMHIDNLYKDDRIFRFDECYALEKVHGTSAHVAFTNLDTPDGANPIGIRLFSGGEPAANFAKLFDLARLSVMFRKVCDGLYPGANPREVIVYGEAYGGKQQGMSETYGKQLKFAAFDVKVDGVWLDVPNAAHIVRELELEFVDYVQIPTKLHRLNEERDRPSVQAKRNGVEGDKLREGIVIRPLHEGNDHRGNRIITKHKCAAFCETKTPREVDPEKLQRLQNAAKIAEEWVTENRLDHILDQALILKKNTAAEMGEAMEDIEQITIGMKDTGEVIKLMIADVERESAGEADFTDDVRKQIGGATARLFKKRLANQLQVAHTKASQAASDNDVRQADEVPA
jgi:hypothetical protein